MALNKYPCPEKPELLAGQAVGMYHYPECGEMQVAGMPHLMPMFPENWELTEEERKHFEGMWAGCDEVEAEDEIPEP